MRGMESYPKAAMERAMKVQDDSHFPPSRRRLVNQNQTSHVLRKADILACLQTGTRCAVEESTWCGRVRPRHIF